MNNDKPKTVQKLVSAFILWCMVAASFVGILTTQVGSGAEQDQPQPMIVPSIINSYVELRDTIQDAQYGITVQVGGTLKLVNSTLNFPQNDFTDYFLQVNGGTLILENSTITTGASEQAMWDPYFEMELTNAFFRMERNSVLAFPGWLNVTNTLTFVNDSWITSLEPMLLQTDWSNRFTSFKGVVNQWWAGTPRALSDLQDDAPVMTFVDSEVTVADSRIDYLYEDEAAVVENFFFTILPNGVVHNGTGNLADIISENGAYITLIGWPQTINVNSFDTSGFNDIDYMISSTTLVVVYNNPGYTYAPGTDLLNRVTYSVPGVLPDTHAFQVQENQTVNLFMPIDITSNVNTFDHISQMNVNFTSYEDNSPTSEDINFDLICVYVSAYETHPSPPTSNVITLDNTDMSVINSYVGVDWTPTTDNYGSKNAFELINGANLFMYNTTISEDEWGSAGMADFKEIPLGADPVDFVPFRVDATSNAYYFKWLETSVTDRYGMPVQGARINATFHFTEQGLINQVSKINDLSGDADPVWADAKARMTDYLGVNPATFNITGADGKATMPLLTTFFNEATYPNGDHVGEYDVNVIYAGSAGGYSVCDFSPVPNIAELDNSVEAAIQLTDLTLPRPFGSPGIIVNQNMVMSMNGGVAESLSINDFIVVEDNGILTISNANTLMAYSGTAPYHIIVRNNGQLILNNVDLKTQGTIPMKIYLQDSASLTMVDSSTTNIIDIVASGNSRATFNRTELAGNFDTTPGSNVRLKAWSTMFSKNLDDLYGTTEAVLVGCYSPFSPNFRISPSDSAKVWVYRLVEVTVYDGLTPAKTLQNANIWITSAYPAWASMLNRAGTTDAAGKFTTPALSDYLFYDYATSDVMESHYNLYSLVTEYQLFSGISHNKTVGLGLSAYPLMGLIDTTAKKTVTLENVLPDLDPPITVEPLEPGNSVGRGNQVWINTTVSNNGDAIATGVVVWLEDIFNGVTTNIHSEYRDSLAPGETWEISYPYTWTSIDQIGAHNITVTVDPLKSIKEQDETNNHNYTLVSVTSQPDLAIMQYFDVSFSTSYPMINQSFTIYSNVWNLGDLDATNVTVTFYENTAGTLLGTVTLPLVPANANTPTVASIPVTFTANGTYYILVEIDEANLVPEVNEGNNNNSLWPRQLRVWEFPDLHLQTVEIISGATLIEASIGGGTPITQTSNRTRLVLRARIQNNGELFASNVFVRFYDGLPSGTTNLIGSSNIIPNINTGSGAYATLSWTALTVGLQQTHNIYAIAYADNGLVSNQMNQAITVVDNRPDIELEGVEFANNLTTLVGNTAFALNATITNNGGMSAFNFTVHVFTSMDDWNTTQTQWNSGNEILTGRIGNATVSSLISGETIVLTIPCIGVNVGDYNLYIVVDPELNNTDVIAFDGITPIIGQIEEYNEHNNELLLSATAIMPDLFVRISLPAAFYQDEKWSNVYTVGETTSVLVSGFVLRTDNPNIGMPGVQLTVELQGVSGSAVIVTTGVGGFFSTAIPVSAEGNYTVRVSGDGVTPSTSWFRIDPAPSIPWWIIFAIILVVVAIIVGITLYLYFVGLGKTVQCGDCGAFIPEGAAKCPKCGVEFETEVAKCSVCGAWVPIDVKNCPDCGTEFTVGTEDLDDYESKMKRQFEDVVRKFREQAKTELGKEFTETEFQAWWAKQPTFITFDLWLKEEEEMKRMGSRPCPICQTENSVTAKICHKCGSVMGEPEKPAPKKPEGKLPPKQEQPPVKQQAAPAPAAAPQKQPVQPAPAQQQAPVQQQPAAPQPVAPAPAQAGKKGCPSCGMEVNATDKVCPICSYEFPDAAGGDARRIIRKPIKKIVRRPGEPGGEGGQ